MSFVCTVSERDLWWKGTIHGRLVRLSSNSRESLVGADAAQFADKELIHISRSIFPRRPWGRVNHWPLYPSSAARVSNDERDFDSSHATWANSLHHTVHAEKRNGCTGGEGGGGRRKDETSAVWEERRERGERRRMNSVESRERTIGGSLSHRAVPCLHILLGRLPARIKAPLRLERRANRCRFVTRFP